MPLPSRATSYSLAILAILASGCPDPETQDPPIGSCVPFGDDEVGEEECEETGQEDAVGSLAPDQCIYNENPNLHGYRIQCEGQFHSGIDFSIVGMDCTKVVGDDFCHQQYPFGPPHDAYAAPDVMACCGEDWDPVEYLDVYQDACMHDLAAQACASIAIRMKKAIEAGDFHTEFGDFTTKATNLQAYIASHFVDCTTELYQSDSDPDAGSLVSHWSIPNKAGPHGWWPAKDIVVSVEAGTNVVGVHRPPDQADWLECHGALDNNDEIFEDRTTVEGSIVVDVGLESSVNGDLRGSLAGDAEVAGSVMFDTHCVDQGCPNAEWSYHGGSDPGFTMEEFELYARDFALSYGASTLAIDRARVELWTQARGTKIFGADGDIVGFEVPAGQAWFYVAGKSNGMYGRFLAVNAGSIQIIEDHGTWAIESFDIEFVDPADRTWALTLGDSRWQQ